MAKQVNNKELTRELRKNIRLNLNKGDKGLYKIAKLAKACMEYEPEYGVDLVWNFSSNCWIECSKVDVFNTACQVVANMLHTNINSVKFLVLIVKDLGLDDENHQFYTPSTKAVINRLKELGVKG